MIGSKSIKIFLQTEMRNLKNLLNFYAYILFKVFNILVIKKLIMILNANNLFKTIKGSQNQKVKYICKNKV